MHVLITGAAGFIGSCLSKKLLEEGHSVVGLDIINDYYSIELKKDRLKFLEPYPQFRFVQIDLADDQKMDELFAQEKFSHVVNLGAQAGVRYSLKNPRSYVQSNLVGFVNVLEGARHNKVEHLLYASSSSVYGLNGKTPFSVEDNVDHPVSLYAASKKSNELMAHSYSHLYNLPTTGLRFFTVYGPWGRPDMALDIFTRAIVEGKTMQVFNHGKMQRDFTFIDDIIEAVYRLVDHKASPDPNWNKFAPKPSTSPAPYRIYNIGNNKTVELMDYIRTLEKVIGKKAIMEMLPMQDGDVYITYANVDDLVREIDFSPKTTIEEGIQKFWNWYKVYYKVNL